MRNTVHYSKRKVIAFLIVVALIQLAIGFSAGYFGA